MLKNAILVICDGLADRPLRALNGLTPLESARTPNLNRLAKRGITGIVDTIGVGIRPGSDTSHLALLGYDPEIYYTGRGVFEAAALGMELKRGDVALRANLATVDENMIIEDRRAGRIESSEPFVRELNGITIDGVHFMVASGLGHRAAIVMRGKGLSSNLSNNDPHILGVRPHFVRALDKSKEAEFTAGALNKFLERAHAALSKNPLNKERVKVGKPPANYLLCRGAAILKGFPDFEEMFGLKAACVSAVGLYKGVALAIGMDLVSVPGATGRPDTDIEAKFRAAIEALQEYDFVFVHIKAADNLAEDGNFREKRHFIERIDRAARMLLNLKETLVVVTADHTTCSELKMHTGDPVPIMIVGEGVRADKVKRFGERACALGGIGRIKGLDVMKEILNLMGRAEIYGA